MSLEIHGIPAGGAQIDIRKSEGILLHGQNHRPPPPVSEERKVRESPPPEQVVKEMLDLPDAFRKRLRFSVDRELDMVVVKVIDAETDKVIKEIPPEDFLRLHARLKEAIGLLIDEKI